jgi:phage tail-like protein
MALRADPYGAFNFRVALGDVTSGGFSEVDGLGMEIVYAEYRSGDDKANAVRKIPGLHKFSDVTLKRGIVGATDLFQWLMGVANGTPNPQTVSISLLDDAHDIVMSWSLRRAQPRKWSGPHLAGAAAGTVAMEELVLVHEGLTWTAP